MTPKKLLAGILLAARVALTCSFVADDAGSIQRIIAQYEKWSGNYPVEKVYLQFDKPYYAAGDDMWFKAYVTLGPKHQLSAISGNLIVDLIDNRGSVKQSVRIPVINGLAHGDLAL